MILRGALSIDATLAIATRVLAEIVSTLLVIGAVLIHCTFPRTTLELVERITEIVLFTATNALIEPRLRHSMRSARVWIARVLRCWLFWST